MPDYHLLNTNRGHLPDGNDGTAIYEQGVAATYGDREEYGSYLAEMAEGDYIISYVNGVGYRAVGKVLSEWDGQEVTDESKWIDPEDHGEYHIDVQWETVVDEANAISDTEGNKLLEYSEDAPVNYTHKPVKDPKAGKRLADTLRGERGLEPDLHLVSTGNNSNNFARTIESKVPKSTVQQYSDIDCSEWESERIPIWGHHTSHAVSDGDYMLLYREGSYPYIGIVGAHETNPELGAEIWESEDREFTEIYYLRDLQETRLDGANMAAIIDYGRTHVQGFETPSPERMERLRQKFGSVEAFAAAITNMDVPAEYDRIAEQLQSTGQVVFHGPPGTGKTHHAKQFAEWWVTEHPGSVQRNDQIRFVTFHPSFSYEDFIQGLTAESSDGSISYELKDGVFKEFVELTEAWPGQDNQDFEDVSEPRYVFIIDEINRGNIASILGETVTLLELDKRADGDNATMVNLSHSNDEFEIPSNVYIIGTMNTADRSLALVDAAIRRRFGFVPFPPDYEALRSEFGFETADDVDQALQEDGTDNLQALSLEAIRGLNQVILGRQDLGKGKQIGHSYLFDCSSEAALVRAWKYEILPLLEEYFHGSFQDLTETLFAVDHAHYLFDMDQRTVQRTFAPEVDLSEAEALRTVLEEVVDETP